MKRFNDQALVFTDLDGTLLDHDSYSFNDAMPTINVLKEHNIPIIINSSKTFEEIIEIRSALNINDPFIVENGAAIFFELDYFDVIPEGAIRYQNFYAIELSKSLDYWSEIFKGFEANNKIMLERFSNMSAQRVCDLTGLKLKDAEQAKNRLYSDPIYFDGSQTDLDYLINYMETIGHSVLIGGRFVHVTNGYNKGLALIKMLDIYKENKKLDYITLALGDSNNDVAMLEKADISIIICNKNKAPLTIEKQVNTYTSTLFGPAGWNEMLGLIIQDTFI